MLTTKTKKKFQCRNRNTHNKNSRDTNIISVIKNTQGGFNSRLEIEKNQCISQYRWNI